MLLVETKGKEMSALLSAADTLEDEKHDVDKKVAEIDAQMNELQISKDQLVKEKADKDRKLEKLLKKKNKLENYIAEKVSEKKTAKRQLEKEIEEIKVGLKETERVSADCCSKSKEAQPERLELLLEYINGQIESKEKELECPVCLAVASPPLFCCDDQHLICAECRPKVCTCLARRLSMLTFCVRCPLVLSAGIPILSNVEDIATLKKQPRNLQN